MFNSISGTVTYFSKNTLYLLSGHIEFDFLIPSSPEVELYPDQEVTIYTYLHHREDTMKLFGFISVKQRELFLMLLKVSGVGPSLAIKIMSYANSDKILDMIESEDSSALSKIPGLGKKTAEKIILALRGKLTSVSSEVVSDVCQDVIDGLVGMGFQAKIAKATVLKLAANIDRDSKNYEEELLRKSIVILSS